MIDDSWKGEHFIRSPKRQAIEPSDVSVVLPPSRFLPGQCGVCGVALAATSVTGVCRAHNHDATHCRCSVCSKRRASVKSGVGDE